MTDSREDKEIDLLEFVHKIFIIKIIIARGIVDLIIVFKIEKEYLLNVKTLAFLVRTNWDDTNALSSRDINTVLYPYLKDKQKKPWLYYIFKSSGRLFFLFKPNNKGEIETKTSPYFISYDEMKIVEAIKNFYTVFTDKKIRVITFECTLIGVFCIHTIILYLKLYVIIERVQKSKNDLEYSHKLYERYKKNYDKLQKKLAAFFDQNENIISGIHRFTLPPNKDEANLAYALYKQVVQQVQMNKIQRQDNIPAFTIIQAALQSTKPSKIIVLISFVLLSSLLGSFWVLKKM